MRKGRMGRPRHGAQSRARRLVAAVVAVIVLAAAGCVFPTPPPGEPVPALTLSLSEPDPVDGEVIVTATPENFTPTQVSFRIDTAGGPPFALDAVAPFTGTLDTAAFTNGQHRVWVTGVDGTYTVLQYHDFQVRDRPNVVFVLVDDLDQTTTPYWDALPQTRALLADRGVTFTNAFATNPVCCPARATLLTGLYPHNTGVFDGSPPDGGLETFIASGSEADSIGVRLQAAGYRTGFLGKYFLTYADQPDHVPPGWDDWFGLTESYHDGYSYEANHNGAIESFGAAPADYQTDVLSELAVDYVGAPEADDDQPFFLFVAPSAPHHPMPPAPRHATNPFTDDVVPTRPNFNEVDVSDKPTWLRDGVPLLTSELSSMTSDYRNRMGSLLAIDDMVANLVAALEAGDELDDTYIVFSSDNGYNLGAHRLRSKLVPYEESIRVPLVITGPGTRIGAESRLVIHPDIPTTVLELAGVATADLDGRSLVPLLGDTAPPWRGDFLIELHGTYHPFVTLDTLAQVQQRIANGTYANTPLVPTYRALRTEQHLYVEWYGGDVHEYELYDLAADPYELVNLVATPEGALEHTALTAALQTRLEELAACTGPGCRT